MRLSFISTNVKQAQALANYLDHENISNQLEIMNNTDWGDVDYGTCTCHLWIIDEDQVSAAEAIIEDFKNHPDNTKFYLPEKKLKAILEPLITKFPMDSTSRSGSSTKTEFNPSTQQIDRLPGHLTWMIILVCSLLLFLGSLSEPSLNSIPKDIPFTPLILSPTYKKLMYDYPQAYEVIDKIVKHFGAEKLLKPNELPPEGQVLLQEFHKTPYWQGIYDQLILHFREPSAPWTFDAPLFEKLRQGEIWRLFTPCLLHGNFLHLIFNMLWVLVLGKQMEGRLTPLKFLLFILIASVIPSTLQYLVSGFDFYGFSGVVFAMLFFVWARVNHAAWEGYQLQKMTMTFMLIYLFMLVGIEITSFFTEAYYDLPLNAGIANTAHLAGAFIGWILGRGNFFKWKDSL